MLTKIRHCSDLHTEFWPNAQMIDTVLPPQEDDKDTLLIMAGDIGTRNSLYFIEIMENLCNRFKDVFYIPGNHEYYGGDFADTWAEFRDVYFSGLENLYMDGVYSASNVVVIGQTLWTDFGGGNPMNMAIAQRYMNDYITIKNGQRSLIPEDTLAEHKKNLAFFEDSLSKIKSEDLNRTVVCVSHHAPSINSIHPIYKDDNVVNTFYHTDLEERLIRKYEPDFWIHGHTHKHFDYKIGKTRVICKPFGYYNYDKTKSYSEEDVINLKSC